MPLKSGKGSMGYNIKELMHAGHPQKQAVAIAEKMAHKGPHGFSTHMESGQDTSKLKVYGGQNGPPKGG